MTLPDPTQRPPMACAGRAALAYAAALLLGVLQAVWLFPPWAILGQDLIAGLPDGDAMLQIVGQRAYMLDAWRWPVLTTQLLMPPAGVNIALTDSIPLITVPAKLLRGLLPPQYYPLTTWLALAWALQPVAAVFALRSAGVRALLPALAAGVISLALPTLFWRHGHAALCSHFLLLAALGLYFRIVRGERWAAPAGAALGVVALLVHPYLLAMVLAVLGAATATLLFRRRRIPVREGAWLLAGVAAAGGAARLLGYLGAPGAGGFGLYSMNLLSPVYPTMSTLLPFTEAVLDGTGGQYEGYQYLGLGLGLVVLCALALRPRAALAAVRAHGGLALVCVLLTLFALSTKVYLGHIKVVDLGQPRIAEVFRSSGRFFWPVTYVLLIGGVALVWRGLPRAVSVPLLLLAALLQFIDTGKLRASVRHDHYTPKGPGLDAAAWQPLIAAHDSLLLWPVFGCGANPARPPAPTLILLAVEARVPSSTMAVARGDMPCPPLASLRTPLGERELRVFLAGPAQAAVRQVPDAGSVCRYVADLIACSRQMAARTDLPALPPPGVAPLGAELAVARAGPGLPALGDGWSEPEDWATWSNADLAELLIPVAAGERDALTLTVKARGFAPPGSDRQRVRVLADGREVAVWDVPAGSPAVLTAPLPPASGGVARVAFRIERPSRPSDQGGADARRLGMALMSFRLDKAER